MTHKKYSKVPSTVGELRQRLEALGNPWTVLPHLTDDDPLPQPPRGGQTLEIAHMECLKPINNISDFADHVHCNIPTNSLLAQHWCQLGILASDHIAASDIHHYDDVSNDWGVA